jgi:hypothetical protein
MDTYELFKQGINRNPAHSILPDQGRVGEP